MEYLRSVNYSHKTRHEYHVQETANAHVIILSQDHLGWEGPLEIIYSNLTAQTG